MADTIADDVLAHLGIEVTNEIKHYGVKGQKWGVRKDDVAFRRKLKNGGELVVTKDPPAGLQKLFSKISPSYREGMTKIHNFTLRDSDGKKVGDASFIEDSPTSLNLMWIGVKSNARGQGYASAAMSGVVKYAKDKGLEKLTLEVPGNSPDALHIYEKFGFKKVDNVTDPEDDMFWGGLTSMELNLKSTSLKHSLLNLEELMEYVAQGIDNELPSEEGLTHMADTIADDVLAHLGIEVGAEIKHYGVKGQKWGVTRERGKNGRVTRTTSEDHDTSRRLKSKKPSEMSNKELEAVNRRLQLERTNNELQSRSGLQKIKAGTQAAGTILAVGTTVSSVYKFVKSPAGQAIINGVKQTLNK